MVTGDGSQQRDFIHVQDLAKANYKAAIHPERINTAFNIGNGTTISVLDLAKMITPNYEFIDKREGEADITFADVSKAKKILEWFPEHSVEDYVKKSIQ